MQLRVACLLPYLEDMGRASTVEEDLFNMQVVSDYGVSFCILKQLILF